MMFKKTLTRLRGFLRNSQAGLELHRRHLRPRSAGWAVCGLVCLGLSLAGCQTVPPLPAVNLEEPGWAVREGQAIWRRNTTAPELAGELLLATRSDGRALVQFTKTPFPFVVAQRTTNAWEIEFPVQKRRYAGGGRPPTQLVWLQLPAALAGQPLGHGWTWRWLGHDRWKLQSYATGESLEGVFNQ